jgi:hypothetical protein
LEAKPDGSGFIDKANDFHGGFVEQSDAVAPAIVSGGSASEVAKIKQDMVGDVDGIDPVFDTIAYASVHDRGQAPFGHIVVPD